MKDAKDKLVYTTFLQREEDLYRPTYDEELLQYEYVRSGDRRSIPESRRMFRSGNSNRLSRDSVRDLKYHFIISASFATRFAIEGGLTAEEAFNIMERFIQQMDVLTSSVDIYELHTQMFSQLTDRVAEIRKTGQIALPLYNTELEDENPDEALSPAAQSRIISECVDYIYYHLYEKIYLEDLAAYVKLSPNYLSTLFHQKRGMTIHSYIRKKRVEAAANMLLYSDYSIAEISRILAFSSSSHFIRVFREENGITPKSFQEQNFHKHWNGASSV